MLTMYMYDRGLCISLERVFLKTETLITGSLPTSEFRDPCACPGDGRGIADGAIGSLSNGDPNTAGLLAPASAFAPLELVPLLVVLLELPPQGLEFQMSAPGQQMAIVWRTELSARTRAWCWGHVLYCDRTGSD